MTKTAAELSEMRAAYEAADAAGDTELADRLYIEFADARRAGKEVGRTDVVGQVGLVPFGQRVD